MFLDLDNFKPFNDIQGDVSADLLLIEVARRLESCLCKMDTVARFGDDEFVLMLPEINEDQSIAQAQTKIVAEKIRAILSKPYLLQIANNGEAESLVEHHCTASIGTILFTGHDASQDDIMKWADTGMYAAQDAGHNQIRFYGEKS
ncbi:MAG: GGDEF domain-containing protein [Methyloprofundus sp.]|nr:GGDEF domain-containing protein [Methyloprofundus sp.]MDT8424723.1 GGDEF domain-containing protein [Methyloprofundus sp.]